MKCKNCDHEMLSTMIHCPGCGEKADTGPSPEVVPAWAQKLLDYFKIDDVPEETEERKGFFDFLTDFFADNDPPGGDGG